MTVSMRVVLLQVIAAVGICILGYLAFSSFGSANFHMKRIDVSHYEVEALIEVANASSQYSEDLAEYLLTGSALNKASLFEARELLRSDINILEEAVIREELFLSDLGLPADPATELFVPQSGDDPEAQEPSERDRVANIWRLFRDLNMQIDATIRLLEAGQRDQAIKLFDDIIDGKIDVELDTLLRAAIADEEQEHRDVSESINLKVQLFKWTAGTAAFSTILACAVLGFLIVRSLRLPMAELLNGADAFGRGNLGHRIEVRTSDELGTLAARFNEMADALREKQDEIMAARTNLESQVNDRTIELATMNQNLTELGELRTRFLADISHELRTPLTALRGEAEVTLRHGRKAIATYRDALNRIVRQSEEMTRLIDDLLLLARSETDDVLYTAKPMLIGPVVAEAARDAAMLGNKAKVAIDAAIASEAIWVDADPQRLKQAVMILLDNAIKYSREGQHVKLTMARQGERVLITVIDEGTGISGIDLPHVFKRFYRGQGTNSSSGSGLGLSIAKWIVEKHGGAIGIESAANSGTKVRMWIPVRENG